MPPSANLPSSPAHYANNYRGSRSPSSRPIHTMNILLSIGILLQIVAIYRTPHTAHVVDSGANKSPASMELPRGLRASFGMSQEPSTSVNALFYENLRAKLALQEQRQEMQQQIQLEEEYLAADERYVHVFPGDDMVANNRTEEAPQLPFQYPKYNYSLPAKRTNYTLSTTPKPTNESNLAVIVMTGRSNFDRRQVIRETWAKAHNNVYFIIGGPEPDNHVDKDMSDPNSTSSRLFQEQKQHGDMLDTVHPDTYKGLPYKLHYAIQWIGRHPGTRHIQWVLKVDDDVVARLNTLQYYVLRKFNPSTPMVIGRMEPNSTPHRKGKWAEDPQMLLETYPPWAYGSTGYVMSRAVIDYVTSERSLYYYQGEDVSLGLWLYESPMDVTFIDSPDFNIEKSQWYNHKYSVVIGHNLSVETIREVFETWKDSKTLMDIRRSNHTNEKGLIFVDHLTLTDEDAHLHEHLSENLMGDDTWYNRQYREGAWGSPDGTNITQYAYNEIGERVDVEAR